MKIYITGIAGFLGSHLAKKLKDQVKKKLIFGITDKL